MRFLTCAVLLMLLCSACGGAAPATPAQVTPRLAAPGVPAESPAAPASPEFVVELTPVPTDTPLPTLELPTPAPLPPAQQIWDGVPTSLADSLPGYDFRVTFDPAVWGLTTDAYGAPALGHRTIPDCALAPSSSHGLPLNLTVEHDLRKVGALDFQVNTAYLNGVRQFVAYTGGDLYIYTAFEVRFQDQADACIHDAEAVLATLTSVPASQATPTPTP